MSQPNRSFRERCSQYWYSLNEELFPAQRTELGSLTPTLEQIIRVLEWVRVEEHIGWLPAWGRPPRERMALARAFCAKAVLGLECTRDLMERLKVDSALARICGFSRWHALPCEATFSRAFGEFAINRLAARAHEALVKATLGEHMVGSISRDATAIHARERAVKPPEVAPIPAPASPPRKRGRPKKGTICPPPVLTVIGRQRTQTLEQMLAELPTRCDHASKRNAKGFKESWRGYKLHIDTAECGVVVSALVTSASVHDSQAAIPLARLSAQRVTYLYELADAGYCSTELRADALAHNHVPLIDHNPRSGVKREFEPHEAQRYKGRSLAERVNSELKDGHGLRQTWVRGHIKVSSHLMFAVLALSAQQLIRLLQ